MIAKTEISVPVVNRDAFRVPAWLHWFGGVITNHPQLCVKLGNLETRYLADRLATIRIDRPIYVAGLARSGTTILLEIIASHENLGTHRYRDFPAVLAPYLWNRWLQQARVKAGRPVERVHRDGLFVTSESPEAMEEMVWTAFFSHLHDPARSGVLDESASNAGFETFYREHIKKILLVRNARRYASKENYNLTRLAYIRKLFPDARFVIPIRHPVAHIASLIKQHRIFSEAHRREPRSLDHFRRVGHFEFGADLRPINAGGTGRVREIQSLWNSAEEVRGWARYWATIYGFVAEQLEAHAELRDASMLVRFEDLCDEPRATLARICGHCGLDSATSIATYAGRLHAPTYYAAKFSAADRSAIDEETTRVRRHFGYE